jgi:hypothetical protein
MIQFPTEILAGIQNFVRQACGFGIKLRLKLKTVVKIKFKPGAKPPKK